MIDATNWFPNLLIAVCFFTILTCISLPMIHYFSDMVSSIGLYHEDENFWVRIALLYRAYVILSIPIVSAVLIALLNTQLVTNFLEALIISIGSYVIFPVTARVLSLANRPTPYVCTRVNWKIIQTRHRAKGVDDKRREIYSDRRGLFISTIFSMVFVAWVIYVIILPVFVFFNGTEQLTKSIQSLNLDYPTTFLLVIIYMILPLFYAFLGEFCLCLTQVEDSMKTP
jgi:hypothetical protein